MTRGTARSWGWRSATVSPRPRGAQHFQGVTWLRGADVLHAEHPGGGAAGTAAGAGAGPATGADRAQPRARRHLGGPGPRALHRGRTQGAAHLDNGLEDARAIRIVSLRCLAPPAIVGRAAGDPRAMGDGRRPRSVGRPIARQARCNSAAGGAAASCSATPAASRKTGRLPRGRESALGQSAGRGGGRPRVP
jgi:hypothetical protein